MTDIDVHDEGGISRRRFLTGLGFVGTAAVAAGYGLSVWQDGGTPSASASAATLGPRLHGRDDRTLVVVELAGGNDGLNTVVPFADPAYRALRPTLGIEQPIALDDTVGFAPELAKLAARYEAGQVAIVEGVGYPDPDLSHFTSLASWWTGTPHAAGSRGWLGRYLDATVGYDDPLAAVGIGPVPSPALLGSRSFATSIADATGLQPRFPAWVDSRDDLLAAWSRFVPAKTDPTTAMGAIEQAIRSTARARTELASRMHVTAGADDTRNVGGYGTEQRATAALTLAAQLVVGDPAPRVVYVNGLGDYDTHQGEGTRHPALMKDLDAGLAAFFDALDAAGVAERAVVMTVSEFGRRPAENGSGTDHGTASAHLLVGAAVRGGRYGASPSLTQLDTHGNLAATTDFRSLYATVLQGWLGVEAEPLVGKGFEPLPPLAEGPS
jgi:uncharacterized protein (DUF1501 family)